MAVAVVVEATTVVAGVGVLLRVVTTATAMVKVVTSAEAHAPLTLANHGKTPVTVALMGAAVAKAMAPHHAVSVAHQRRAPRATISMKANHAFHAMKCSAKTHAAHVSIWASNATTSTNVNRAVMCQPVFRRRACPHAAAVVVAVAATEAVTVVVAAIAAAGVVAVAIGAVAAHAQVAVAVATRAAGFSADRCLEQVIKKQLRLLFCIFSYRSGFQPNKYRREQLLIL